MKFIIDGQEVTGIVEDGYVKLTFVKNTNSDIEVMPLEDCGGITFLDEIQLEKGNQATSYEDPALIQGEATGLIKEIRALQFSIHDPDSGLTSRFAQLAQGFEQEVTDLIGGYSRQGQTIDGLFTDIYSPDGRVSQVIQTVDGFKQTVDDLESGTGTTFEQLSNGFRQRIDEYLDGSTKFSQITNSVSALEQAIGDPDSLATSLLTSELWRTEVTNLAQQKVADGLKQEFETVTSRIDVVPRIDGNNYGTAASNHTYYDFDMASLIPNGETINVQFIISGVSNTGQLFALEHVSRSGEVRSITSRYLPTGESVISISFNSSSSYLSVGSKIRIKIYGYQSYVAFLEIWYDKEHQVPIVGENTGAISSQITQLYNMINLSILGKDGAMSRIAMGEEGIQIDGKLLHITAKTNIDDAVIKSAMIDTLDAGKITTGELNASLIRVVNLDANSIAGNEASFIRAMFSGTKSTLQITASGVSVLDNSGRSSTFLDSSGIEFSRSGINLGKLEYVNNITDSGDLNGMHGFSMRPNRDSYFGVSYYPTAGATTSIRRFAVSGRTGNVYISGLIKPSEQQPYGIDITWGTITGRGTNVRIYNHDRTGGIQINSGDLAYLTPNGWRSLNDRLP